MNGSYIGVRVYPCLMFIWQMHKTHGINFPLYEFFSLN